MALCWMENANCKPIDLDPGIVHGCFRNPGTQALVQKDWKAFGGRCFGDTDWDTPAAWCIKAKMNPLSFDRLGLAATAGTHNTDFLWKGARSKVQSITRRWLRGSLLITICILAAALGLFLYYSHQNFNVRGAACHAGAVFHRGGTFAGNRGTAGSSQATSESRSQSLRRTVEQFDEKDKFEFMLLDSSGVVLATSSGTMNKNLLSEGRDFYQAVTGSTGSGMVTFRTADGEHVMAVTSLVPYAAGNVTAMRLVTSLTLVDRQWYSTLMVSFGVAAVVLGFAVFSGLFFIRTIVRPLGQVEATANRIAHGDLTTRLPDAPYDDEIGRLCKAINQMAEDLTKTERMKNEFISSVSHELRTPLTSIKGWVETIANIRDPDDENYRKGITIIRSETDRLYNMVEELLDFSPACKTASLNCEVLICGRRPPTLPCLWKPASGRCEGLHLCV